MESAILKRFKAHPHWPDTEDVLKTLSGAGFQAVLAGGCVRDALLNRPLNDFDVATDAIPDQVEGLFKKTLSIGKAFGVIKVIGKTAETDVATFRTDGEYKDGRHPESIAFANLNDDANRRDFTINALFYSYNDDKIIDVIGGERDLNARVIRTVGSAQARFTEDSLRALRAVRFSAQLGFVIDDETWRAVEQHSAKIPRLAKERQSEELRKLAASEFAAKGWECLRVTGLFAEIFPDLSARVQPDLALWHRALRAVASSRGWPLNVTLGWFGYCYGFESDQAAKWIRDLKGSSNEQNFASAVTSGLHALTSEKSDLVSRLKLLDAAAGVWLLKLWPLAELPLSEPRIELINSTVAAFKDLMEEDGHLQKPWINGKDLIAAGFRPGAEMGRWLTEAYDLQLGGAAADKAALIKLILTRLPR